MAEQFTQTPCLVILRQKNHDQHDQHHQHDDDDDDDDDYHY